MMIMINNDKRTLIVLAWINDSYGHDCIVIDGTTQDETQGRGRGDRERHRASMWTTLEDDCDAMFHVVPSVHVNGIKQLKQNL